MKRLLLIAPHLSTGGSPQYLVKKVEFLKDEYDIFVVEYSDVTGGKLVVQRNRLISLLKNPLITLGEDKSELLNVIRQVNPHIVHMEEIPEMFCDNHIANQIYDLDRTYSIYETSHDSSFDVHYKRYIADKMILVSEYQRKLYEPLSIPIEVIDYPIEFSTENRKGEYMKELGLDPSKKHILNVGLFTPRKNQKEFFEYARRMPEYQFHSVGNMADNFKFYWEPLLKDVPPNLKIWDERSDVHKFFEAMDLLLFTSRGSNTDKETMPLVLKEAVASKIPICLYNLDVYEGFFDQFNGIHYLDFNNITKNMMIINNSLNFSPSHNTSFENPNYSFHRLDGSYIDFSKYNYPNSMQESAEKYGSDWAMYWGQFVYKELNRGGVNIETGDVYVDLGANIGMSARYAELCGAKKIYCVEPDLDLVKLLKKNVPNANIIHKAVGTERGQIELYHWPYNPVSEGPKYMVDVITLSDIISEVGHIDYLKVDIEGFEETLFDSITAEQCKNVKKIFIEHHNPSTFSSFCEKIKKLGYDIQLEYGNGQNYLYGNIMGSRNEKYRIDSKWNLSEQTIYYWTDIDIQFPITVCLREYQSDAVLWASHFDNMPANIQFWMIPIPKNVKNYELDETFTGVKLCIYNTETDEQIYEKPYYTKFVNKPNLRLSNFIPYQLNYEEFYVHRKYDKWLSKKYKTVIDAGANVGVFSQYMIDNGFAENILAIECDSLALKDLKNNFRISDRVNVIPKALHYDTEPIELYESEENPVITSTLSPDKLKNHMAGVKGNKLRMVDTITISDIVGKYEKIDLFKIDIEGGEYDVIFNTDKKYFENIENLLIECHFFEDDCVEKYQKLLNILDEYGYEIEEFVPNLSQTRIGASEAIFCKKKEKTIFIIDVYADTPQKEQILKKCIESIKPLGYDILITTHKQIKEDVANMVDYVLFDRDNQFNEINFFTTYTQSFPNFDIQLYTTPDMNVKGHEFPIIKAFRNALSFSKGLGYTQFIFSEFDSIFSDVDLNLITDMVDNMKDKKFSVLKNGDDGYETIFFMGNISYFLNKMNSFFPKTVEEYNKKFTYQYPYRLEFFMREMLVKDVDLGVLIDKSFYEYFESNNKNIFRIGNHNAYIIPDQHGINHICLQNFNQFECDAEVFVDDNSVFKDTLISTIKDVYTLKSENKNVKCVFSDNGNLLKEVYFLYDETNDYSKNGKLNLLW